MNQYLPPHMPYIRTYVRTYIHTYMHAHVGVCVCVCNRQRGVWVGKPGDQFCFEKFWLSHSLCPHDVWLIINHAFPFFWIVEIVPTLVSWRSIDPGPFGAIWNRGHTAGLYERPADSHVQHPAPRCGVPPCSLPPQFFHGFSKRFPHFVEIEVAIWDEHLTGA